MTTNLDIIKTAVSLVIKAGLMAATGLQVRDHPA